MRRSTVLSTVVALGIAASAFAAPVRGKAVPAWASGQIERFDQSTQTLVVKQGAHEMTFVLAANAKVSMGKQTVPATDLTRESGRRVKVQYVLDAGQRKASRIEVSPNAAPAQHARTRAKS
jgi:hypothetical protein